MGTSAEIVCCLPCFLLSRESCAIIIIEDIKFLSSNPLFNFFFFWLLCVCVPFNKRNINKIPTHSGKLTATANRSQLIYWENIFFRTIFGFLFRRAKKNISTLALHGPSVVASPARRFHVHVQSGSGITSTSVRVPLEFHAN